MDEEEKKKQGPDLIGAAQNARALYSLAKKLQRARTILLAASTSEIWIPLVVIGVIATFTFLIVLGGQGQASEVAAPVASSQESINTTKTNINTHFYCQYDGGWTNSCDIVHYGCDPTSLAMILSSFGDTQWTPSFTATNNNMGCFQGTTEAQTLGAIEKMTTLGYTQGNNIAKNSNFNLNLAKTYIERGYLIHAAANVYFRSGGPLNSPVLSSGVHSFVITGVDPTSKTATILDPTYCTSDTNYITKTINVQSDALSDNNGNGWFWAYPIKKVASSQ